MTSQAFIEEILDTARVQGLADETIAAIDEVCHSAGMSNDVQIGTNHQRPHDFLVITLDGVMHYVTTKTDEQGMPDESVFLHSMLVGAPYVHAWPMCRVFLYDYLVSTGIDAAIDQMLDRSDDEQGDGQ